MIAAQNGHFECLQALLKYEEARKTMHRKNNDGRPTDTRSIRYEAIEKMIDSNELLL